MTKMAALSHPIQGQFKYVVCGMITQYSKRSYASQNKIYIQPNTPPHQRRGGGRGGRLLLKAFLLVAFKNNKKLN